MINDPEISPVDWSKVRLIDNGSIFDVHFKLEEAMAQDNVNHPAHYNSAGIECIDAMEAMVEGADVDAHVAYCWQNAFKYLWRWPYKNGLEDLKKARWYLDRIIDTLENKKGMP